MSISGTPGLVLIFLNFMLQESHCSRTDVYLCPLVLLRGLYTMLQFKEVQHSSICDRCGPVSLFGPLDLANFSYQTM